ncbi:MAG: C40 family peptidase [Candidatus Kapaibacteriota bacterium]
MIKFTTYITIIIFSTVLAIAFSGCQSVTRFTNNENQNSMSSKSKNNKIEKNNNIIYKGEANDNNYIIEVAENWIGTPYQYGGDSKKGVDCSAFVQNVYSSLGVNLPRTAQQQYNFIPRISQDELKPGDLIFFGKNSSVSHVAIYIGNGKMIHASSSQGVIKQDLNTYSGYSLIVGFGRPNY